jgi:hypothetical protein
VSKVAIMCGVAILLFAATAAAFPALDPKGGVVLPLDHAADVAKQCSRGSPGPVEGTWLPSANEIRDLEARLPQALDDALGRRGRLADRSRGIGRQYAGLRIAGRNVIYVNGFPLAEFETDARYRPGLSRDDWKKHAIMVCDGGPAFFGAEYDPETKTFSQFQFNGPG